MNKYQKFFPMGIDVQAEIKGLLIALGVGICFSFRFLLRFSSELGNLYYVQNGRKVLRDNAFMPDFADLFEKCTIIFPIIIILSIILCIYHYSYHYQGSKSIYLMRRLPTKTELHKRCVSFPLFSILLCIVCSLLLLLIYFAVYMICTPDQCLFPDQWHRIWTGIF